MATGEAARRQNAKWVKNIQKFAEVVPHNANEIKKEIAKELFTRVINRTPTFAIDDPSHPPGTAKGNWGATKNRPSSNIRKRVDSQGQRTIAAMETVVDKLLAGEPVFLSNSVPYIRKLEDGGYPNPVKLGTWDPVSKQYKKLSTGGWSNQLIPFGPAGMVKITLTEFEEIANSVLRKYRVNM